MREGYSRGYEGMGALRLRFEEFGSKHEKRTRLSGELWRAAIHSDVCILLLIAVISVLLRTLINGQYGFHRDELLTYTNARHLDWGYVSYPPITPFLARVELEIFGTSLRGFRFFGAVAQSLMMLFAGLSARELGGTPSAQVVTAIASASAELRSCMARSTPIRRSISCPGSW